MIKFEEFLKYTKVSGRVKDNAVAELVFKYLCEPENIYKMCLASDMKLPVLTHIVKELEDKYSGDPMFDLEKPVNRQTVGVMIKFILQYMGYAPSNAGDRNLRNFSRARIFKTSSVYSKVSTAKYIIRCTMLETEENMS